MQYCTIIQDDETRLKFVKIAQAMNLKVYWMTEMNSIDPKKTEGHNTHYYMTLRNESVNWDVDNIYFPFGRLVTNQTFITKMYLKSL